MSPRGKAPARARPKKPHAKTGSAGHRAAHKRGGAHAHKKGVPHGGHGAKTPNGRRARKGVFTIAQARGLLKGLPKNKRMTAATRAKAKSKILARFPSLRR